MKRKHTGKIIALFALLFVSSFGETVEKFARTDMDYDTSMGYGLLVTLANISLISAIMMAVPLIARLIRKEKLPQKSGKQLCIWNSIILFILSSVMLALTDVNFIGGIGAIVFYFINKWIFVGDLQHPAQLPIATNIPPIHDTPVPTTVHSTHICLSAEGEPQNACGDYHVHGSDIMLEHNAELPKAAPVQPASQPKAQPIHYAPTNSTPIKYCSRCGNAVDPVTKKCLGCGKQYLKGISRKTALSTMIIILFVASLAGNIILCFKNNDHEKTLAEKRNKIAILERKIADLQNENEQYFYDWIDSLQEITFYHEHIVFVVDNGTNLYHKYDCTVFQNSESFWAFNTEAAEYEGYVPCSRCCD